MQLAQNPRNHGRTKHIRVRFHRIREYIGEGEITVKHVPGLVNSADGFTKPLTGKKFAKLVKDSGLIGMDQQCFHMDQLIRFRQRRHEFGDDRASNDTGHDLDLIITLNQHYASDHQILSGPEIGSPKDDLQDIWKAK